MITAVKLNWDFLEKYINGHSPVTMEALLPYPETSNQERWAEEIRPYVHKLDTDAYGNTWAILNPDKKFTIVLEAHADEISWRVKYITERGFMYFDRNGGSDHLVAGGTRGYIHTKERRVPVIFPSPAIHLREFRDTEKEFRLTSNTVCADAGMTKEELLKIGVNVGSIITHEGHFQKLGSYITGRAFDNRAGGFVLTQIAKNLKELGIKIPYRIIFLNAVQEEVGLKGAGMFVNMFDRKINAAVCFDVCHATKDYPFIVSPTVHGEFEMGKGPVLTRSTIMHTKLSELIEASAAEDQIPFQLHSSGNTSGTDTDQFHARGIPTALVSFALENMHTQVEKMSEKDLTYSVQLLVAFLYKMADKKNQNFKPLVLK